MSRKCPSVHYLISLAIQMQRELFIEMRPRALQALLTNLSSKPKDLQHDRLDPKQ